MPGTCIPLKGIAAVSDPLSTRKSQNPAINALRRADLPSLINSAVVLVAVIGRDGAKSSESAGFSSNCTDYAARDFCAAQWKSVCFWA
jgi:hypothetical protein